MKINRRSFLSNSAIATASASIPALAAISAATSPPSKLAQDPRRPQFHLLPAANWMNDPNGPIFWKGQLPHVLPIQPQRRRLGRHALGPRHLARHDPLASSAHRPRPHPRRPRRRRLLLRHRRRPQRRAHLHLHRRPDRPARAHRGEPPSATATTTSAKPSSTPPPPTPSSAPGPSAPPPSSPRPPGHESHRLPRSRSLARTLSSRWPMADGRRLRHQGARRLRPALQIHRPAKLGVSPRRRRRRSHRQHRRQSSRLRRYVGVPRPFPARQTNTSSSTPRKAKSSGK